MASNLASRSVAHHAIGAAAESQPLATLVFSWHDGRLQYRNPAAVRLARLPALTWKRMTLSRWLKRLSPAAQIEGLAARGERGTELELRRGDGLRTPVSLTVKLTRGPPERRLCVVIVRDVSARDEVMARWRASEAAFRELAENAPALVWTTDARGRTTYLNRHWLVFTGRDSRSGMRVSWWDGLHPDDRDRCARVYRVNMRRRTAFSILYRRARFDGVWRWLRVNAVPYKDSRGDFVGFVGICTDVTDLLDAKQAAELASENLRLALRAAGIVHWYLDPRERLMHVHSGDRSTPRAQSLESWLLRVPKPERQMLSEHFDRLITEGVEFECDHRVTVRGAGTRYQRTIAQWLRGARDGSTAIIGMSHDVTPQRELELRMIEISGHEQRRIGSDLHDSLGQDLTGISLLLEQCRSRAARGDPELAAGLEEISAHLRHTLQAVRSLAFGLCPVGVDGAGLGEALRRLVARYEVPGKWNCDIDIRGSGDASINTDAATHVFMVAQEALSNAVRHGHASRASLQLEVRGRSVELTVDDNGVGIPADMNGTKGMGLALMRYRARLIGGTLAVGAAPTGGTRVRLIAPLNEPDRTVLHS